MNVSLLKSSRYRYIFLISFLVLMLKKHIVDSSTTVTDCAAIVDGPSIEGRDDTLEGNETHPVVINCQLTCLSHSVANFRYNPGLDLIVTKLGKSKEIPGSNHSYDTEDGLYQSIIYTSSDDCEQTNNYTMQFTFFIHPTIMMDRTAARCGVSYYHNRSYCWGEEVIFIRYTNASMPNDDLSTPIPPPCTCPTPDISETITTTDITNVTSVISEQDNTITESDASISVGSRVKLSSEQQSGIIAGVVVVVVIGLVVAAALILLGVFKSRHPHTNSVSISPSPPANKSC